MDKTDTEKDGGTRKSALFALWVFCCVLSARVVAELFDSGSGIRTGLGEAGIPVWVFAILTSVVVVMPFLICYGYIVGFLTSLAKVHKSMRWARMLCRHDYEKMKDTRRQVLVEKKGNPVLTIEEEAVQAGMWWVEIPHKCARCDKVKVMDVICVSLGEENNDEEHDIGGVGIET